MTTQEILNGGLAAVSALTTSWAVYMTKKSRTYKKNEEESLFIDNASKLAEVWEKLSKSLQDEVGFLRAENKEMLQKYTDLKVELETQKNTSAFIIKKLELDLETLKMENANLKVENSDLREQVGTGVIKRMV